MVSGIETKEGSGHLIMLFIIMSVISEDRFLEKGIMTQISSHRERSLKNPDNYIM